MTTISYGSKYVRGLDVSDIAKCVRRDIAAAVKSGELPPIKTSVTISRYSGGRSLRVKITACPVGVMNIDRVLADAADPHGYPTIREIHSEAGREILARVESIVSAYNFDGSDTQSDYFHVNFYGFVDFASELEKAQRAAILASLSNARAA